MQKPCAHLVPSIHLACRCNSAVWRALRPINDQHHAWEHIVGREDVAVATLQRIAAETAAERAAKAAAGEGGKAAAAADAEARVTTKATAANGHVEGGKGTSNGPAYEEKAAPDTVGRRTLRSGKVLG